jgi:hypothetical protein
MRHFVKLEFGLLVEVAGQVFGGWIDGSERLQIVNHLMVQVLDDGTHNLFEQLEVEKEAGFVKVFAPEGDENLIVMAVRVLALAAIIAEVVAGGKTGFYSYFKHDSGVPSIAASGI